MGEFVRSASSTIEPPVVRRLNERLSSEKAGSAPALANLASVSTGSTTPAFAATAPAGTYFVRVRALNSTGASAASNEVTIVVP